MIHFTPHHVYFSLEMPYRTNKQFADKSKIVTLFTLDHKTHLFDTSQHNAKRCTSAIFCFKHWVRFYNYEYV